MKTAAERILDLLNNYRETVGDFVTRSSLDPLIAKVSAEIEAEKKIPEFVQDAARNVVRIFGANPPKGETIAEVAILSIIQHLNMAITFDDMNRNRT